MVCFSMGEIKMEYDKFYDLMAKAMEAHKPKYGDSWKEMSRGKLLDRLKHKFAEFDLTYDKDKLISLANLCMLLYLRMDGSETKKRMDMI